MMDDRTSDGADEFEETDDFDFEEDTGPEPGEPSLADATDDDSEFLPPRGDNPWERRAGELADWALARVFVRTDRYGSYVVNGNEIETRNFPSHGSVPNALNRATLIQHFKATKTTDVVGAHTLTPDGDKSRGKWVGFDIDAHTEQDDPALNRRYVEHLHAKLSQLGFKPLTLQRGFRVYSPAVASCEISWPGHYAADGIG